MSSGFAFGTAFRTYLATGLSAFEAGVGERFDHAAFKATGVAEYGLGLRKEHAFNFHGTVVAEAEDLLARHEAAQKAAEAASTASARTSTGPELSDALSALSDRGGSLAAHDLALIAEAARRLRAR